MDGSVTQEDREAFWTAIAGWSADMPTDQRSAIERRWTDEDIAIAKVQGFA